MRIILIIVYVTRTILTLERGKKKFLKQEMDFMIIVIYFERLQLFILKLFKEIMLKNLKK